MAPAPIEAAGTRYRVQQYFPYLRENGFECELRPFLSRDVFKIFYEPGHIQSKLLGLLTGTMRRVTDVLRSRHYDVVYVAREAMLFGPAIIEWLIRRVARTPLVFDFDDALHVPYISPTYGRLASWFKCPQKTIGILTMSNAVVAGSSYLAEFARRYCPVVSVIPTVVDPESFSQTRPDDRRGSVPVIGWIGSPSSRQYLDVVIPALQGLSHRYAFLFRVVGAGEPITISGVAVENRPWFLETELREFRSLDIGVYPVRDDEWARGKCGFKAIQYMAAGVPAVCSPVGSTTEIVTHEVNGFLATSTAEWTRYLEILLTDHAIRNSISTRGVETVVHRYSLHVHAPRLAHLLRETARGARSVGSSIVDALAGSH